MRVEAIMQEDGLFIPMNDALAKIPRQRLFVEIKVLEDVRENTYDALDQLVGICETGISNASVDHDDRIYGGSGQT